MCILCSFPKDITPKESQQPFLATENCLKPWAQGFKGEWQYRI